MKRFPHTKRIIKTAAALVGVVAIAALARAEVSVEVDPSTGAYLGYTLRVNQASGQQRIWEFKRTSKRGVCPLNVDGDLIGDGMPLLRENLTGDRYPWAVWDRVGADGVRRLVHSRWTGALWTEPRSVSNRAVVGPQSSPTVQFNTRGRAYLAHVERGLSGLHHVRFTLFLVTGWADSIEVSGALEDATAPSIEIVDDQTVEVSYGLPDGSTRTVTVRFANPNTITDDVYPFLTSSAQLIEGKMS